MAYPATWQCMDSASIGLRLPPDGRTHVKRPMDGLSIGALTPQEDEFALLSLGIPSVYRGFFDPRRLPELARWLNPAEWERASPYEWIDPFSNFLSSVSYNNPGRLILKSPSHSFRIRALLKDFPNSSFIWVTRNPRDAFLSNRKMWLAMFERYSLWDWDLSILDQFLVAAFTSAAQCLREIVSTVPHDRLAIIDFYPLTNSPLATLESVNRSLRLGDWQEMTIRISGIVSERDSYRPAKYAQELFTPAVMNALQSLEDAQKNALELFRVH